MFTRSYNSAAGWRTQLRKSVPIGDAWYLTLCFIPTERANKQLLKFENSGNSENSGGSARMTRTACGARGRWEPTLRPIGFYEGKEEDMTVDVRQITAGSLEDAQNGGALQVVHMPYAHTTCSQITERARHTTII
eukprot:6208063-Pleurochrysis_carterae.AAC.2